MQDFISHSRPTLGDEEIRAAAEAVASGHIAQGPAVAKFERAFADHFGFRHALATSSGTAALHLALAALGIADGDEVVMPAYVCSALMNAVRYVGATPVLADVDAGTGNFDADKVRSRLTARTRAVIVPHMFGLPVDPRPLSDLGVAIIEDCAQAVGARCGGRPVGALGDLAVFSFYATKVLTTGEGGMVVCRSADLAARAADLRSYDERNDYRVRYNYKLTDIQAAIGCRQLARLDSMLARRRQIARHYFDAFQGSGFQLPVDTADRIFFRFTLKLKSDASDWIGRLARLGIGCARPVHQPLHRFLDLSDAHFPGCRDAWRHLLSIPIYPSLTESDAARVVAAVKQTQATLG